MTAFDGDDAGRQASLRAYDLLREVRAWPTALDLPAGQDPASLAAEHGTAGLQAAAGKPLVDLVVDERIARHHLRWPEGQIAAGRAASAVVAAIPPEHVSRQIVRIIAHTGLDARTVTDLLIDAVTSPSSYRSPSDAEIHPPLGRPHAAAAALSGPVSGPPRPASPARTVASTSQSAAQLARAGFPVALNASLRPPAPAALGTSPPVSPPPDQQRRSRTA